MQERGGVFSHLRSNSPDYARAVTNFRREEQKKREATPHLEELPDQREINQYIQDHHLDSVDAILKHEHQLSQKLNEAIFLKQPLEIERLRRIIWMISNDKHQTSKVPSDIAEDIARETYKHLLESPLEFRGEDDSDIAEHLDNHAFEKQIWLSILGALHQHLTGQELVDALHAKDPGENNDRDPLADFEYRYERFLNDAGHYHDNRSKKAKETLENMRIVRDRLYFDLLYPQRASLKYRLEQQELRRQKKQSN